MRAFDLAHLTSEQKAKLDAMEKELDVVLIAWDQKEQKNSQENMNYDI
ncbi:hypothetical protein SAMN04488137_2691 [Fictibacillus solisalsi]|uniref:Uncharacterized protein n=1 Tax=Fictibacillus solisalsi TaxID=459525 RepID=A0A1G9XCD8_9BACL|nr:hypothetical protein [Fictibacillus solisalsi]SDM94116.1 hypothetical protein SAMN04488137_2691 [Fictibacillus solisalsi]